MLFNSWVMSNSSQPHGLQHAVLLCPSLSPGICSMSCSLRGSHYLTISSFAALFSFCLQSFPATESFPVSRLFASGTKVLELQLQHQSFQWIFRVISFRIDWFDLLAVQGTLMSLVQHHDSKASILTIFLYLCMVSSPSWSLSCALKRPFHCTIRWCVVL